MQAIQRQSLSAAPCAIPVAIYTRVSTLHQVGGRFDSCESQAAICRDHVQRRAAQGWFEAACYSDPAYSGGTMKRPGMEALMRHIAAGGIKIVLIFKFERVLRSTDEWGPFRAFLKKHGCRLESPMENLSDDTPMERFNNNQRANLAEFERLNTAEKVRAKLAAQAERGIWNCGLVPYGYTYDSRKKALSPHPVETAVVRRIYKQAAQLVSLTEIANALNSEGLRTRDREYKRRDGSIENVGGKRFKSDALRNLIQNPIYAGRLRFQRREYPGQHEPLVSADLWERATAAVLKALQPARCWLRARDKNCHILKGLAFCAHCRRAMIPNASGKRDPHGKLYRYYTCCHAHREKADAACPVRNVSAALLELTIVQFIGALARHPDLVREALTSAHARGKADRGKLRGRLAAIDQSLATLHKSLRHVVEAIAAGGADMLGEELREKAAALKEDKQRLLVEREQVRQDLLGCDQDRFNAERLLAALARFGGVFPKLSPIEQKDLLGLCVDRVELRAGPAGEEGPGVRQYLVRLKLHVERLVEGMEERVVVERGERRKSLLPQRPFVMEPQVVFHSWGRSPSAVIVAPFREEFREGGTAPATEPPADGAHPLHRALKWQRRMSANPRLSQAKLARKERVTGATLTYHLKLLRLTPQIQEFLLTLKTAQDVRRFSLRKMIALAEFGHDTQRKRFAQMPGAPALSLAPQRADLRGVFETQKPR
ncbi:MAG: recombinase family protein [Opitutaceae bacterium]|nr:recombinase family protein [Opitutaceae bacterium]